MHRERSRRIRTPPLSLFGGSASGDCWSSSQNADNANNAWNQNFDDGNQNNNNKNNTNRVRAVRDSEQAAAEPRRKAARAPLPMSAL